MTANNTIDGASQEASEPSALRSNSSSERQEPRTGAKIILAAGGTGGHVYTATAVGEELAKRGYKVMFMTDKRGTKYLKDNYKVIAAASPNGLKAMPLLSYGILQSLLYLIYRRPKIVIGFGGYPSFPPLFAAKLLGLKTLIHEQNSVLGKVNKFFAQKAVPVATAFPETKFAANATCTGQPVRHSISPSPYPAITNKLNILITGGSQGAKLFADILPEALCPFAENITVAHQVPDNKITEVKAKYQACGMDFDVQSFFNNMPERLNTAHLVISRAGAATVFELAIAGRPAIFVPLKIASDNHQFHNTDNLCKANASWMLEEKDFNKMNISAIISELLAEPQKLVAAATNIKTFARPNAASELADLAEKMLNK